MARESFSFVCPLLTKLWSLAFTELDVCRRPLFANPVTYLESLTRHHEYMCGLKLCTYITLYSIKHFLWIAILLPYETGVHTTWCMYYTFCL